MFKKWYEFEDAAEKQAAETEEQYIKFCNAKTEEDLY